MIAVDTNLLVYAHRADAPMHARAVEVLRPVIEGRRGSWGLVWPCVHEFLATVTRSLWAEPTPVADAVTAVRGLLDSPTVVPLGETHDHLEQLAALLTAGTSGPRIHDARIAAICLAHGVTELWTADRDFGAFPDLRTHHPLAASGRPRKEHP